jgi:hypothetical protein
MNRDEKFIFSSSAKKKLFTTLGIGVLLFAIGVFMLATGGSHEEHGHQEPAREGFHAEPMHANTGDSVTEYNAQTEHVVGVEATNEMEKAAVDTAAMNESSEHAILEDTLAAHGTVAHTEGREDSTYASEQVSEAAAHATAEAKTNDHHDEHAHAEAHEGGHHEAHWSLRIIKDLWLNNVFFAGIALIGVFFMAFNYVAWAGWSAGIKRIPEAFGAYLPVAAVLTILLIVFFHHDLFHWTHADLYDKSSPHYDSILDGKKGYLNFTFFLIRAVVYFAIWISLWKTLRNFSIQQDLTGDLKYHFNSVVCSAVFIVAFGITESMAAWDWLMSTDPHFFSTMFGWYAFASWFVSGLALITLIIVVLKENGYLSFINENHLHDLGKFVFAFTVFWTYVWFEQFLLIYYANIPEEVGYFVQRLKSNAYTPIFFLSLFINFFFPFLGLMTRAAKRQGAILKVVCVGVICGHWLDFYMMVTPPILGQSGGLDLKFLFVEVGMAMIFASVFLFTILTALSKVGLVAKNHPMLEESEHHSVF